MLTLDLAKWQQTPADIRELSLSSAHPRTRERFLALYELTQTQQGASLIARGSERHAQTLIRWVHWYNEGGPEALVFRRTGGPPPFCPEYEQALDALVREGVAAAGAPSVESNTETGRLQAASEPEHCTAPPRWTLKKLVAWLQTTYQVSVCRETVRRALKRLGLSWKKAKALLNRAKTAEREAFAERLQGLLERATVEEQAPLLVYIDEAHIHQDADLGYGWAPKGERLWVGSHSPGLSAKVSFYGVYFYNAGQVEIWEFPRANTEHTLTVLQCLRELHPQRELVVLWDNVSYHRALDVRELAEQLRITLMPLPTYSPDFMPVEALWRWLREEVTYHHCHATADALVQRVHQFVKTINRNVFEVADRLWVKIALDPDEEKLRIPC